MIIQTTGSTSGFITRTGFRKNNPDDKGDMIIRRYADDLVVGFQHRTDAERFLGGFKGRLAKFGLELQDTADRVRALCGPRTEAAWRGKARDFHLLGLHPFLWAAP